ncbi:hypothetical protein BDV3_003697 [Batrachochytrium dendrobatidis]|nr:hypothetical protein O5D80_002266 [Batrachochytrium dendrobatidis]KAK5669599.1 hypothetical protein QVD99_003990 [Batrachochytrium dendrobatidis]
MSSGFGIAGGRGRCFNFWQEFTRCHVQAESTKECVQLFEDYQECLYHRKEFLRMTMVRQEHELQQSKATTETLADSNS